MVAPPSPRGDEDQKKSSKSAAVAPKAPVKPPAVVDDGGWTGGQKALAAIAVILLLTALGLVGYLVSQMNTDQTVTPSTTVVHQSPATTTTTTKTTSRTPRSTARTTTTTDDDTTTTAPPTTRTARRRGPPSVPRTSPPDPGAPTAQWPRSGFPASPAADRMNPTPPLLSDRYQLGETLGFGGMSEVHYARDLLLNRDVAIRCCAPISPAIPASTSASGAKRRTRPS